MQRVNFSLISTKSCWEKMGIWNAFKKNALLYSLIFPPFFSKMYHENSILINLLQVQFEHIFINVAVEFYKLIIIVKNVR